MLILAWLPSVAGAIASLAWLTGLWYAAPLLDRGVETIADRLRNAICIGVAIPLGLGFLGVFSGPGAFLLLGIAVLGRRRFRARSSRSGADRQLSAVMIAVLLFAWPQLVHPILDGDSLGYHLPNAGAWAQSHSIWQTNAREWFYPAASELFAAPFFAFGARWSLPVCGVLPALLLLARITIWGREIGLRTLEAGLCALALIATPIASFEVGTLQNDLWLAAFFIETLYVLRSGSRRSAAALTSLLKPVGFAYSALAIVITRRFDVTMLLAFIPLVLWIVRDAVLLPHAQVAVEPAPDYWPSTIAGDLAATLRLLPSGLRYAGWAAPVFIILPFIGLALPEIRAAALAGSCAAIGYLFLPYSFAGSVNFVAAGTSLRFALPAMACGALVLCALTARFRVAGVVVAVLLCVGGIATTLAVFWNDGWAGPVALGLTPLCVAAVLADRTPRRSVAAAVFGMLVLAAAPLASVRAAGFFQDWLRGPSGAPTHVFDWIAGQRPPRIVVWNVRSGSVLLMSPTTRTLEATDNAPCRTARDDGALLLSGTDRDLPIAEQVRRRTVALACGRILYRDDAALVVEPR